MTTFSKSKEEIIAKELEETGIDIRPFINPDFNYQQVTQVILGLRQGLDVTKYNSPSFDNFQMYEIRKGLQHGIDISSYANPELSSTKMHEIRSTLENDLMKAKSGEKVLVEVAEHPIKYTMDSIKQFGVDAINNSSIKQAYSSMKANLKSVVEARQMCIDSEYTYRTYKQQAFESIKNIGKGVVTPIKHITSEAITSTMTAVKNGYKKSLECAGKTLAVIRGANSKTDYQIREIVTLGRLSYAPQKEIADIDKKIQDLQARLKTSKNPAVISYINTRIANYNNIKQYLTNGLEKDVWKGKSPERRFQETIKKCKTGINNLKQNTLTKIANTKDSLNTFNLSIKNKVFSGIENISNNIVNIQNKISDYKVEHINNLASTVIDISNTLNNKKLLMQKSASKTIESFKEKTELINSYNQMALGVSQNTIDPEIIMSDVTKSLNNDLKAIDAMNNPDAARLAKLRVDNSLRNDKKEINGLLKKEIKEETKKLNDLGDTIQTQQVKASLIGKLESLSKKLNNVLLRAGQKIDNHKWKTVSIMSNLPVDQIKEMIDKGIKVDFNKLSPTQLNDLNSKYGITFSMNNGQVEMENEGLEQA